VKAVRLPAQPPLGHEHEFEPEHGLPERLPAQEHVLWQGSPDWAVMARRVFHVRKLVVYFAALVAVRLAVLMSNAAGAREMVVSVLWMLLLAGTAIGLLSLVAWLSARATVYTITDKRVVMRVGIVLTLTFNIPFKRMVAAGLRLDARGFGDIPLTLGGDDHIAWLHLWPHVRPWRLARPEPMLRCVPQAGDVAGLLTQAWSRSTGLATPPAGTAQSVSARPNTRGSQPALAGP
jgi:hypothetical protein